MAATKVVIPLEEAWFDFERYYPHFEWNAWMLQNRFLSVIMGGIYMVLLYIGRASMKNRPPHSARLALALWNLFMTAFSLAVLVRVTPYFLKRTFQIPFFDQMCTNEYERSPVTMFWLDFFVLTKPIEFIDTLFIVLRKQHLHFLHWYHHITVVILCWYSLGVAPIPPNSIYYVELNAYVHTFMYAYYFLRSVRITVPRIFQMLITIFQIIQMIIGTIINVAPFIYRVNGVQQCDAAWESIYLALAIYFSYLLLFVEFFYKAYFAKKPPTNAKASSDIKIGNGKHD